MVRRSIEATREIVLAYLDLIGANVEETAPGVIRAELTREEAVELDGGANLFWLHPADARQKQVYYFTFSPEAAERDEEVELVSLGSHRAQQVMQAIRKRAQATRMWLPAPGARAYRPFFFLLIRLDFEGSRGFRRIVRIAVDRVDEIPLRQLAEMAPRLPFRPGTPQGPVEPPVIGLADAFHLAYEEILTELHAADPAWAEEALAAVEAERKRLAAFYDERLQGGDDVSDERACRLAELDAMRPRVTVRLQGAAEAFLPIDRRGGEVRHLAFDTTAPPFSNPRPAPPGYRPFEMLR